MPVDTIDDQILAMLRRRPMNLPELVSGTNTHSSQLEIKLKQMETAGSIRRSENGNDWEIIHP